METISIGRFRPRRLVAAAIAVVGIAAAATVASLALAGHTAHTSGTRLALGKLQNHGGAVALSARSREEVRAIAGKNATSNATLIAIRNGQAFYRITRDTGNPCYGTGPGATAATANITGLFCPSFAFPSAQRPVISVIQMGASRGSSLNPLSISGFAADGVKAIGAENASGTVVAQASVLNNVFSFDTLPLGIQTIVGLDAGGKIVFRQSW